MNNPNPLLSICSSPPRIQQFSLPESVVFFIAKNPLTSEVYEKLIKICKYFYLKARITTLKNVIFIPYQNYWSIHQINGFPASHYDEGSHTRIYQLPENLWIHGYFKLTPLGGGIASTLSKIHWCDVHKLGLENQVLSEEEFDFLIGARQIRHLGLVNCYVAADSETAVPIEKLIEKLPKLQGFTSRFDDETNEMTRMITPETAEALTQIPHFGNLKFFYLTEIKGFFDFTSFLNGLNVSLIKLTF